MIAMAKRNDDIVVLNPKKRRSLPNLDPMHRMVLANADYPRVIPHVSKAIDYTAVDGKVRGKQEIRLCITVGTGVWFKYRKKTWQEVEQFHVDIPFKKSRAMIQDILAILKRHSKGDTR